MTRQIPSADTDVAIVGAGPYGLSIAAHLNARGVEHRIIGTPMQSWLSQMPTGMLLKSLGFASSLYDPAGTFALRDYCSERGTAYDDLAIPVPVEVFSAYGLEFQKRLVPQLEERTLVALNLCQPGFQLQLDDGTSFTARRVVVAVGITYFGHMPAELAELPAELVSHSSKYGDLTRFRGRDVCVIGAGSSAIDLATLLHEAGAVVRLVARRASPGIEGKLQLPRPLWQQIRHPMTGIGPGWRHRFYTDLPWLFHYLPEAIRLRQVRKVLGPSAGYFIRDRFAPVPRLVGCRVQRAEVRGGSVHLDLVANDGTRRQIATEHVIAATGYKSDLRRLPFLSDQIRSQLRSVASTPVLSSSFESSVRGLYFVGTISANSFGPVMRFAVGAKFAAPWISRHLARTKRIRTAVDMRQALPTWERVG